jgi:hypothetical protein
MQKGLSKLFIMLMTLGIFLSNVAAVPAQNKSVILTDVRYVNGVGIVLLFDTTGLTKRDLRGATALVHSSTYDMSCSFKGDTSVVRCVIPGGLSKYAGESFSATLAGFRFWGEVPADKSGTCSDGQSLWYSVDVYDHGELVDSGEIPAEFYSFLVNLIASQPDELEGISLQISGQFCGEEIVLELPE